MYTDLCRDIMQPCHMQHCATHLYLSTAAKSTGEVVPGKSSLSTGPSVGRLRSSPQDLLQLTSLGAARSEPLRVCYSKMS